MKIECCVRWCATRCAGSDTTGMTFIVLQLQTLGKNCDAVNKSLHKHNWCVIELNNAKR